MKTSRVSVVLSMLIALGFADHGDCGYIVVPNVFKASEGNSRNIIPFFAHSEIYHYQQVYDASQFENYGRVTISQIAFRPDITASAFNADLRLEIDLSTTNFNSSSLTPSVASNRGPDVETVFSGLVTFVTTNEGPALGPKPFQAVITLDTPFIYYPANGNLLMEIRRPAPVLPYPSLTFLDATFETPGVGRLFAYTFYGGEGNPYSGQGLVTRFTIPEPAALFLVTLCLPLLIAVRRTTLLVISFR